MNKKKKKGFTLIELIVVIAILGILAAVAIPKFANVQNNSKIGADIATSNSIINAAKIYVADKNLSNADAVATGAVDISKLVSAKLLDAAPQSQVNGTTMQLSLTATSASDDTVVYTVKDGSTTPLVILSTNTTSFPTNTKWVKP